MREILIATLLLGCLFTFASAERGLFEFHDSYGRCWRCLPGSACVRCSTIFVTFVTGPPTNWTRTCEQPTTDVCNANPGVKFPHQDIGFYWICADDGIIAEAECFCDHVFDMRQQQCVLTNDLTTIACDQYANPDAHDCTSDEPRPPPSTLDPGVTTPSVPPTDTPVTGTTPSVPTAPNESTESTTVTKTTPLVPTAPNESTESTTTTVTGSTTTTNWVPTAPNDTTSTTTETTTTTSNGITDPNTTPTRTTENGLPDGWTPPHFTVPPTGSTTTIPSDTTPAPCVCIVWWPCWCNPCWNMPCHSCNGCVGMMG